MLGKYGFFVEKITHFLVHSKLLLVKNKLGQTQLRSYTSCWSTFAADMDKDQLVGPAGSTSRSNQLDQPAPILTPGSTSSRFPIDT